MRSRPSRRIHRYVSTKPTRWQLVQRSSSHARVNRKNSSLERYTYLNKGIVQEALSVRVCKGLCEHDVVDLSASTENLGLEVNIPLSLNGHDNVPISTDNSRCLCSREQRRAVYY